jgi:steroid delta-isomerase-like uncharacterized protein
VSTTERNEGTLRRFIEEVWNQGDCEAADRCLAPRYTIHHDPGDPWDGRELDLAGFKERVRISRAPFPDQRFAIRDLMAEGDRVIITWHWQATHLGEFPGFPPTGQTVRMSGATVYDFDDGRIAGHWQVTDRLGVYLQLQQAAGR